MTRLVAVDSHPRKQSRSHAHTLLPSTKTNLHFDAKKIKPLSVVVWIWMKIIHR